jgi:hypothetical protein
VRCGKDVRLKARFSMIHGGLVCPVCDAKDREGAVAVTPGTVATLLYVEKNSWNACQKLHMPPGIKKEVGIILNNFLLFHLGRRIRSVQYLS